MADLGKRGRPHPRHRPLALAPLPTQVDPVAFAEGMYFLLTEAGLAILGVAMLRSDLPIWIGWMLLGSMVLLFVLTLIYRDMVPLLFLPGNPRRRNSARRVNRFRSAGLGDLMTRSIPTKRMLADRPRGCWPTARSAAMPPPEVASHYACPTQGELAYGVVANHRVRVLCRFSLVPEPKSCACSSGTGSTSMATRRPLTCGDLSAPAGTPRPRGPAGPWNSRLASSTYCVTTGSPSGWPDLARRPRVHHQGRH